MRIDKFKTYLLDCKNQRENSLEDIESPVSSHYQETQTHSSTNGSLHHTLASMPASISESGSLFSHETYSHNESAWW